MAEWKGQLCLIIITTSQAMTTLSCNWGMGVEDMEDEGYVLWRVNPFRKLEIHFICKWTDTLSGNLWPECTRLSFREPFIHRDGFGSNGEIEKEVIMEVLLTWAPKFPFKGYCICCRYYMCNGGFFNPQKKNWKWKFKSYNNSKCSLWEISYQG